MKREHLRVIWVSLFGLILVLYKPLEHYHDDTVSEAKQKGKSVERSTLLQYQQL